MSKKQNEQMQIKAGDIYAVPLNDNEYFFIRVLINVWSQCVEPDKIRTDSALAFAAKCCLIEIYRDTTSKPENFKNGDILIPGLFCSFKSFVENGQWTFVGNQEVDINKIYFPAFIQSLGMQNGQFVRGEVRIEFPMRVNEVETIGIFPESYPGAGLKVLYLYNAGRKKEIPPNYEDIDRFDISQKDLYFSHHLAEVKKHAGTDVDLGYNELGKKYGFDLNRFY